MAGGTLSEGDESEEENVEKLQGIIRFFILDFWGGFCTCVGGVPRNSTESHQLSHGNTEHSADGNGLRHFLTPLPWGARWKSA